MEHCRQIAILVVVSSLTLLGCSDEKSTNQNLGGSSSAIIGGGGGTGGVSAGTALGGATLGGATNGGTSSTDIVTAQGGSTNTIVTGGVAGKSNTGGTISSVGGTLANSGGAIINTATAGKGNAGGTTSNASGGSSSGSGTSAGGAKMSGGTSSKSVTGGSTAKGGSNGTGSTAAPGGGNGTGGIVATGGNTSTSAGCLAAAFLSLLGKSSPLIGAAMEDATADAAPFDGRYLYLSGGYFDGTEPCTSCASGCTAEGVSCANTEGCGWWGCWQWDQDPPGQYVLSFVTKASSATYAGQAHPQIPLITYYQVLQASGADEGSAEVAALDNRAFLHKYFADFRLVLQKVGDVAALLHIEPDFWGYVQQSGSNPHLMAAPVTEANPTDCGAVENSVAGFARCLIAMVRKYTPNSRIGLHASGWGTNFDVLQNTDPSLDVAAEAKKLANYLLELGAGEGDFIVADMSDRDAGYYQQQGRNTFWDVTNAKLPNFHQAFEWAKVVSDTIGKPILWWQIPVGNMSLNNTTGQFQDNRVDYLLTHMSEVAAANGAGLFFGSGATGQTTPESDGGNLISKVKSYSAAPAAACP